MSRYVLVATTCWRGDTRGAGADRCAFVDSTSNEFRGPAGELVAGFETVHRVTSVTKVMRGAVVTAVVTVKAVNSTATAFLLSMEYPC